MDAPVAIISIAQQARPNVAGHREPARAQLTNLAMFVSRTPDGMASSIYGQWPPLVNAARKPGEWQTYDIVFHAAKFKDKELVQPATVTVLHNGVITQEKKEILGPTQHRQAAKESAYDGKGPISLQDHGNPTRFRNIWIRPIKGYDGE